MKTKLEKAKDIRDWYATYGTIFAPFGGVIAYMFDNTEGVLTSSMVFGMSAFCYYIAYSGHKHMKSLESEIDKNLKDNSGDLESNV